jgi:serine palmitoyltransferase
LHLRKTQNHHLHPSTATVPATKSSNPTSILPKDVAGWDWDVPTEENILQDVVDEALAQGLTITKAKRLRGQEMVEASPSIRLALTSGQTKKETGKAVNVVKHALVKDPCRRR